mmetsp:Transcript_26064/g.57415  ORF Transcript_26064/g.57415 Transcript_26064/m.57415 type:complete len:128 (+) Transcript_26064:72-455(+)
MAKPTLNTSEHSPNRNMKFQQTEGQNENEQNLQLKRPLTESGTMSLKQSQKSAHAFSCKDSCNVLPDNPSTWPQCPLMIRPTPHSSTKVIGIVSYTWVLSFSLWHRAYCALSKKILPFHFLLAPSQR